jgi:hypothetical protein
LSAEQTIEGWRQAMPDFMDAYERSGLMPNHPVHGNLLNVNDHLVYQVVEGNVTVYPEIEGFTTNGVRFGDGREKDFDTVIFCTGFKLPNVPYFPDISPADLYKNHFHPDHPTMAVMGHYPSTLGCFSTLELGARWFAMALSGKVSLPDKAEMLQAVMADKARVSGKGFISKDPTLHSVIPVDTPLDNIWFAEQIGAFPNPTEDWSLYWELINLPPIPSIYRLTGPHAWDGARAHLDSVRERLFSRQDDDKLIPIKHDMLSRLGEEVVRRLHESGQISADEAEAALTLCRQVA